MTIAIWHSGFVLSLGRVLRRCRKNQKCTIEQLAQRAGVRPSTISEIENDRGNPELRTLTKLTDALGTSLAALGVDMLLQDDEAILLQAYRSLSLTSRTDVFDYVTRQAALEVASARERAIARQSSALTAVDRRAGVREMSARPRRRKSG